MREKRFVLSCLAATCTLTVSQPLGGRQEVIPQTVKQWMKPTNGQPCGTGKPRKALGVFPCAPDRNPHSLPPQPAAPLAGPAVTPV